MGECAYSIKIAFKDKATATATLPKIKAFLIEVGEAYSDSFDNKDILYYEENYPLTSKYSKWLESKGINDRCHDFGQDEFDIDNIHQIGNVLSYSAGRVGHLNTWQPLANYMEHEFGALRAVWASEEDLGVMDGLSLYDYEDIVNKILAQKELLPLLLGIHPDLDELLEMKLKG